MELAGPVCENGLSPRARVSTHAYTCVHNTHTHIHNTYIHSYIPGCW